MSGEPAAASKPLPRLRADLQVEKRAGGTFYVKVVSRPQGFLLYDLELALAKLLDGRRSAPEVLEQAGRLGIPATPESLHKFLRQLWQYGFLDTPEPAPAARTVSSPETFSGRAVVMRLWSEDKQEEALSYLEMLMGRFPEDEGLMQLQTLLREKRQADLKERRTAPAPEPQPAALVPTVVGPAPDAPMSVDAVNLDTAPADAVPVDALQIDTAAPGEPAGLDQDRDDEVIRQAVEGAPDAAGRRQGLQRRRRVIGFVVFAAVAGGVSMIPLPLTITEPCLLVPSQEAVLRASGVNRILSVAVKEGQEVAKGDLLMVLEASEALKEVQVLEAERAKAVAAQELGKRGARPEEVDRARKVVASRKAEVASAARSYQRKRALFGQQMVSRDELDTAQSELVTRQGALSDAQAQLKLLLAGPSPQEMTRLEADLKVIDARLQVARAAYAGREVTSPIAGRVATARVELKQDTNTVPGAPMVEVINTARMRVELYVPQGRLDELKLGLPETVKVPNLPDERFEGTVEFISPVAESRGEPPEQYVRVDTTVDNPRGLLKPQMTGYGEIRLGSTTVGRNTYERLRRWLKYRLVL